LRLKIYSHSIRVLPRLANPQFHFSATVGSAQSVYPATISQNTMSTFNGMVTEFPRIRIDFFRINPLQPPPLACFLSHIHSDHLQGLESLKAPFVYCSAATRRLLLRLEKYPHRINFMKGVLESRKQHYRHLRLVLKAIPLECPTEIELGPLENIRVTLFDANHCPGAVMFLIEGDNRAILYTGDVRSEPWWVNSVVRNPILLPYTAGLKQLDRMYLDTTFATKEDIYRRFPSKAEGIRELLTTAGQYPPETSFYLNAWTLGYEDVWVALSSFLKSSVSHMHRLLKLAHAHFSRSTLIAINHDSTAPCLTLMTDLAWGITQHSMVSMSEIITNQDV
jgi:DNA cross-link repair 1C protein